jgi:integrative and conjugative element protein (TIGR02256 family)
LIRLSRDSYEVIADAATKSRRAERGGILVGYWEDGIVFVRAALKVRDGRANAWTYTRRRRHAQSALDRYRNSQEDERLGYVGEWHTHTAQQPPSETDYVTMMRLAADADDGSLGLIVACHSPDAIDGWFAVLAHPDGLLTATPLLVEIK